MPVDLPHDAMLLEKRDGGCRNGVNSGYFPGGKYTYEKAFELDAAMLGKSVVLHFEGVYQNCKVYANRKLADSHRYGYTAFDVDISDFVQSGENTVRVEVDNSLEPNCRWYSGSGIYRPVQLLIREKNHITQVHLETVDIHPAKLRVDVQTTQESAITVEVYEGKKLVASGKPGILEVPEAKLWSGDHPFLYTVLVKTDTDERVIPFGIRKLEWSAKTGMLVNGHRVLLRGGCIHHDHGVLGACEYYDAEERRIRILKENGFNAVRIAHNPASQITLDICDKLGMYVMNETFDGWYIPKTYHDYARWFDAEWKKDLTAIVESSRNHPCVILYSTGNEVSETATQKGAEVCRMLTDFVHSLDNTRPVTAGVNVLLNVYANMGMSRFLEKWLKDVRLEQGWGGGIPMVVPRQGSTPPVVATACWGDCCILVPWAEYLARGNRELLKRQYSCMKKFMKAVKFWASLYGPGDRKYIWKWLFQFGDWCAPEGYIKDWLARGKWMGTAYYANSVAVMAKIAEILGESEERQYYEKLHRNICRAFCNILTDGHGKLTEEFQTGYVLPLYFGIEDGENRKAMADNLNRLVVEKDYHLTTGFPGTPYILFALADNGYADTAFRLLLQDTCPSWLYCIKMGATTFWEQWNAITPDGEVRDPSMNHYAYGAVGDFLYRRVLGLEPLEGGYRSFRVKPLLGGGLTWAKGSLKTPYGMAAVHWEINNNDFIVRVEVPTSTKCELVLPSGKTMMLESGTHRYTERLA